MKGERKKERKEKTHNLIRTGRESVSFYVTFIFITPNGPGDELVTPIIHTASTTADFLGKSIDKKNDSVAFNLVPRKTIQIYLWCCLNLL